MCGQTKRLTSFISCSRLFPLPRRQQRVISRRWFFCSRGESFSESYHSACDIRPRGPPSKHPPETSPASALTRREIIGLPGYRERGGTFQSIPIFVCVFKPFSTSKSRKQSSCVVISGMMLYLSVCMIPTERNRQANKSCTNPLALNITTTEHGKKQA